VVLPFIDQLTLLSQAGPPISRTARGSPKPRGPPVTQRKPCQFGKWRFL